MNDILSELNSKEYIFELNDLYNIKFCDLNEIEELVEFIELYWKEDHIFVKNRELLDWQHLDIENNRYNFVIARSKEDNLIHAILGFVPTSQFDKEIKSLKIWPCIWKIKDNIKVKGLGVSLYYYLKEHLKIETMEMLGISEVALGIYKKWGFKTGKISQYYIINDKYTIYNLITNIPDSYSATEKTINVNFQITEAEKGIFDTIETGIFEDKYKSKKYYINRYFNHPVYKYDCYIIYVDKKVSSILFTRDCYAKGSKCIRIVDYLGDKNTISILYDFFKNLIYKKNAEYIDFVLVGWEDELLLKSGFLNRDHSEVIIPNYFEPFELKNIYLDYAHKSIDKVKIEFYKADADQDRPNV